MLIESSSMLNNARGKNLMSNNLVNKLSRRHTLNLLGVGGFTTAFALGSYTIVNARNARNARNAQNKIPSFIQEWADIQNSQDAAAQTALFTEDGVLDSIPFKVVVQGRDDIQRFFESIYGTLSNISVEILDAFATDEWAVADYNFIATNIGLVSTPSTLNKSFTVRSGSIFKLKENKILYFNEFFDLAEILLQIGAISSLPLSIGSNNS
jgi:steroid delta-isomerase-like uncharacterized protein